MWSCSQEEVEDQHRVGFYLEQVASQRGHMEKVYNHITFGMFKNVTWMESYVISTHSYIGRVYMKGCFCDNSKFKHFELNFIGL